MAAVPCGPRVRLELTHDHSPAQAARKPLAQSEPAPRPPEARAEPKPTSADQQARAVQMRAKDPGRAPPSRAPSLGQGKTLPTPVASRFSRAFGHDFRDVRVHPESPEAEAMGARAFTAGKDVAFAPGEYRPGTPEGDALIAHELAHVVQQSHGAESVQMAGGPSSAHEVEADKAAAVATGGGTVPNLTPAGPGTQKAPANKPKTAVPVAPGEVDLSTGTFLPDAETDKAIQDAGGRGALVNVKVGSVAHGQVRVKRDGRGRHHFVGNEKIIPIVGGPLAGLTKLNPHLQLELGKEGLVTGFVTPEGKRGGNALAQALRGKEGPGSLGWHLVSHVSGFELTNSFQNGAISVGATNFKARFGNAVEGTASFSITDTTYSFDGSLDFGTDRFKGIKPGASFTISRSPEGKLQGSGKLGVALGGLSTEATVSYVDGQIELEGTLGVQKGAFSGSVTLIWASPTTIRQAVAREVPAENLHAGPEAPQAEGTPKPRQIAGIGKVQANISEWLAGSVMVIVDGAGNVTVVGEFAPPAEVNLFPQKDFEKQLFKVEARAAYGVPVIGNVFVFANASMSAVAKLGPLKLYKIKVSGVFSTDSTISKSFTVQASLNLSAFAGLQLRAEGGVGLEIVGHDIKAGVGVQALAGLRGYVEATPKIGVREKAPGKPEFFLDGHMELAAQPVLILSGDLFVELDSPWWSPAPDKKWKWPVGELEYPLPGEFGIGADVSYVLGSKQVPEVKLGEVDFDASKFTTDLMNDKAGGKGGGKKDKPGKWGEGKGGPAPGKGKGKGGGKDEGDADLPPEARWYGPIGSSEPFTTDGESHRLYITDRGPEATLMMASTPTPIEAQLKKWEDLVDQLPKNKQAGARQQINAARNASKKVDKDADKLASLKDATKTGKAKVKPSKGKNKKKGEKIRAKALNDRIKKQQKALATRMSGLGKTFKMVKPKDVPKTTAMARGRETVTVRMFKKTPTLFVRGGQLADVVIGIVDNLALARERSGRAAADRLFDQVRTWLTYAATTKLIKGEVVKARMDELVGPKLKPVLRAVSSVGSACDVSELRRATKKQRVKRVYKAHVSFRDSLSPAYKRLVKAEARRQLDEQARRMSKLTVDEWMTNVNTYNAHVYQRFQKVHSDGKRAVLEEVRNRLTLASSRVKRVQAQIDKALHRVNMLIADWDAGVAIAPTRLKAVMRIGRLQKYLGRHGDEQKFRKTHKANPGNGIASAHDRTLVQLTGNDRAALIALITAELNTAALDATKRKRALDEIDKLSRNLGTAILHNPDQYFGGRGKIPPVTAVPRPTGAEPPDTTTDPAWRAWKDYLDELRKLVGVYAVNSAIGNARTGWGPNIKRIVQEVRKDYPKRGSWELWKMAMKATSSFM